MEYITVYEIENNFFPYYILIPTLLLIVFGFLAYKSIKLKYNKFISVLLTIITIFSTTLCITSIYNYYNIKTNIVDSYFAGEYLTVEGTIENFDPLSLNENGTESFEVNGIEFRYSDSALDYIGYKSTLTECGVITNNGQKVRIRYVYNDTYDMNIVLKLDIEK